MILPTVTWFMQAIRAIRGEREREAAGEAAGGWAGLQLLVAAVAGHAVAALFAAAEIDGFRLFGLEFLRRESAALVLAVAEWLAGALAAAAEPVALAGFDINGVRGFLGDDGLGFGHGVVPVMKFEAAAKSPVHFQREASPM